MELRQLALFVAVAEELNFTRAASRMHISQPPLSRQIARLEASLQVRLLDRTQQSVTLTAAGHAFLPEARRLLAIASHAPEVARRAERGESGVFRIGFVGSMIYTSAPALIGAFRRSYPSVDISLVQLTVTKQVEMLLAGDLDIGFIRHRLVNAQLNTIRILKEPLIVALSADHPLAKMKAINLAQLADENFISFSRTQAPAFFEQLLRTCDAAGFSPRIAMEAEPLSTMIGLVAAGAGIAIVPESTDRIRIGNVAYRKLAGPPTYSELLLAWRAANVPGTVLNFLAVRENHISSPSRIVRVKPEQVRTRSA